jgi:hypothetical protein
MRRRVSVQNGMPIWLSQQFEAAFPPLLLWYFAALIRDTPQEEVRPVPVAQILLSGSTAASARPGDAIPAAPALTW